MTNTNTAQQAFAERTADILKQDEQVIGLAAAGSWITNEIDAFSDLDLIIVTKEKIGGDKAKMMAFAKRLGHFLSGFTGEHVSEPRVLICLYDNPLLHVDLKFVSLEEFKKRIETPVILLDKEGQLQKAINESTPEFPYPNYQWIEDRFWIWIHYALLKIGRGEYMEAFDFFGFLRMVVFGPLLHIKNGNLPRGVRKVETQLVQEDFKQLRSTIPIYTKESLLDSLQQSVALYRHLRKALFPEEIEMQKATEEKVMDYFQLIKNIE